MRNVIPNLAAARMTELVGAVSFGRLQQREYADSSMPPPDNKRNQRLTKLNTGCKILQLRAGSSSLVEGLGG